MKELCRRGVYPHLNKKEYVIPLWLQEVLQDLKSQNKQKTVIVSR
jgi:hypothetical protein